MSRGNLFDLYNERGWELYHKDIFEEAVAEWRVAADLDPEDGYVLTGIGQALAKLGQPEAAFGEWQKAIHLEPDYDVPYIHLADALLEIGWVSRALTTIRTAIRLCPTSANLYIRLGHYLAAQADENSDKGGWEAAAAAFQQAVDIEPANHYALIYLAKMQWLIGKKRKATVTLEAAVSANPEDFKAHKQLLGYQTCTGNLRGAIRTVQAIYALPETEETNQYVADSDRLVKRLEFTLCIGAGIVAVLVGVLIWRRRD